ncbi:hypothetical protein BYT27DRAFT_7156521 [Phlegmacium glaucopus]|nr:hypothetical protein BYT27DRAFT_7156521 [Phlegmacium glaucopus]
MAHNSGYYQQQQQQQQQQPQQPQYTQVYPQSQPQNIYQQLGKPQPQPHLQRHPTYQQPQTVQPQGGYPFSQQQYGQQIPQAPYAPPQTPYQLSQTPHVSPQTPYPQSQTPYIPSQPPYAQSQTPYPVSQTPYAPSQTPYQQAQYPVQQQPQQVYSSHSPSQIPYVPQTSFASQTPGAIPTSSSGSSWRVPASRPPPIALSATLAQQAQAQAQVQVPTQAAPQTPSQTPARRPLPQPSPGANAKTPILPFASPSADNPPSGSNRPFPTQPTQTIVAPSSNPPSPTRGRPLPTPAGGTDKRATVDLGRLPQGPTKSSSSVASSAFSTSSISSQPQPVTTKRTPSPTKSSLPPPSSHSPVKNSEPVGLSRTSSYAIQSSVSSAPSSATPKRRNSPPRFQSQPSSESNSPTKDNAPALPWNKSSAVATSTIPKSTSSTSSSSTSTTSANTTTDTSAPPPKKFTPIWRRTIPDYPAPAWGYAAGMVSEPHPKPKAQVVPTQPAPVVAPPANAVQGKLKKKQKETVAPPQPPVPAVSSTKGVPQYQQYPPSQYQQSGQSGPTSVGQPAVQQRHTYQQQQQAYYGHIRTPNGYDETQDEDDEDDEDDSEEETDSDEDGEEEDEEDDEQQPDPRYNPQNERQKYTRPIASLDSGIVVASSRGLPRRRYDQEFEEEEDMRTPKRKLRLKPKDKTDPYTAYTDGNTLTNGHTTRIVPRRARDDPYSQEKDITPKATKTILKPKRRVLSEERDKMLGFGAVNRRTAPLRDVSDDDHGRGERKRFQMHERSRSAYEERERDVVVAKQRRQLEWEGRAGSAFSVDDEKIIRRRKVEDDREVRLAYDDDDDDEEEEEEEEEEERMRGRKQVMKNGISREGPERERRQGQGPLRGQGPSPQWGIRDLPANRRAGPATVTRYGTNYEEGDEEEEEKDQRYRRIRNKEKKEWDRSPISEPANRRFRETESRGGTGLPQPPAMVREIAGGAGVFEKPVKGGPRWKPTTLKYDDYHLDDSGGDVGGRRKLEKQYQQQEGMTRKFAALGMNDRTRSVDNQSSTGSWPADLPRLPRTPGSSSASSSVTNDGGGYFDMRPQPGSVAPPASQFGARQQLRSTGISGKMNMSLDDPPPRATIIRSPSPGPPVLISRREPLPQPPARPESQTYSASGTDDGIEERLQRRRSLYSAPEFAHVHEEGLRKRPQSQIYGSSTTQMQAPIGSHDQQHQFSSHPPFPNQIKHMPFNTAHYQSQTPAPPPTIGIESPHPVGGRDKLADIPKLEEGSNDESEGEHRQRHNHRRAQREVPRINIASDPSPPPGPPRIQVDGAGSVPRINIDSSPRMNNNNGGAPSINVEPPRINVDGGGSPRKQPREVDNSPRVQVYDIPGVSVSGPEYDGPSISVSGPDDRNPHSHRHAQSASQQSQFGGQPRPGGGGLICGGCNGSIIGRIVSAMGSRWHPACFRCTVCDELLEHVSSYEHEGRPYCHLDYHEKFAPRCYSCKTAIVEEQFISLDDPALGKRTYHTQHFFCAECGDPFLSPSVSFPDSKGEVALSGDGEFEGFTVYKGHPYCEACHVRLRLPKCKRCKRSIRDHDEAVEALGGKWCWGCFVCASCDKPFDDPSFFQRDDKPFCERCFSIMLRNEV